MGPIIIQTTTCGQKKGGQAKERVFNTCGESLSIASSALATCYVEDNKVTLTAKMADAPMGRHPQLHPFPHKESTHITTDCVKVWEVIKQPMCLN